MTDVRQPPEHVRAMLEGGRVPDPTAETYEDINRAYRVFNERLFDGRLEPCLITLRARQHLGYFSPWRFAHSDPTLPPAHEIALNPEEFGVRSIEQCLSTLARMQVHQLQHQERTRGRRGYENNDFAERMLAIGLGVERATGFESRERMKHYIIPGGRFSLVAKELVEDADFRARWADRFLSHASATWGEGVEEVVAAVQRAAIEAKAVEAGQGAVPASDETACAAPAPPAAAQATLALALEDQGDPPPASLMPSRFIPPSPAAAVSKAKFQCPLCRVSAWGRPSLKLVCADCRVHMNAALPDRSHLGPSKARPFRIDPRENLLAG